MTVKRVNKLSWQVWDYRDCFLALCNKQNGWLINHGLVDWFFRLVVLNSKPPNPKFFNQSTTQLIIWVFFFVWLLVLSDCWSYICVWFMSSILVVDICLVTACKGDRIPSFHWGWTKLCSLSLSPYPPLPLPLSLSHLCFCSSKFCLRKSSQWPVGNQYNQFRSYRYTGLGFLLGGVDVCTYCLLGFVTMSFNTCLINFQASLIYLLSVRCF